MPRPSNPIVLAPLFIIISCNSCAMRAHTHTLRHSCGRFLKGVFWPSNLRSVQALSSDMTCWEYVPCNEVCCFGPVAYDLRLYHYHWWISPPVLRMSLISASLCRNVNLAAFVLVFVLFFSIADSQQDGDSNSVSGPADVRSESSTGRRHLKFKIFRFVWLLIVDN